MAMFSTLKHLTSIYDGWKRVVTRDQSFYEDCLHAKTEKELNRRIVRFAQDQDSRGYADRANQLFNLVER